MQIGTSFHTSKTPGITKTKTRVSGFFTMASYLHNSSKKILKQKIALTVFEISYFCVLFQLHPGLSQTKTGT